MGHSWQVSRCDICNSKFHWVRECPYAYENSDQGLQRNTSENVLLSLFVGCTNSTKLQSLGNDAKGCALLDIRCSSTVNGKGWLQEYLNLLIVEQTSASKFSFDDSSTVESVKQLSTSCLIGNMKSEISTDVVKCEIPLLLSKNLMKKANMILNFQNDTLTVGKGNNGVYVQVPDFGQDRIAIR